MRPWSRLPPSWGGESDYIEAVAKLSDRLLILLDLRALLTRDESQELGEGVA